MDRHSRIAGRSCLSAGGRMAGSLIRFTLAGAAATLAACQSSSPFDDPMFERKDLDRLVSDAYDTPWRGDGMIVPETPPIPVPDRPMASGGAPLRARAPSTLTSQLRRFRHESARSRNSRCARSR
jgi:hypothetical protein